jgi:hypothetical protein
MKPRIYAKEREAPIDSRQFAAESSLGKASKKP